MCVCVGEQISIDTVLGKGNWCVCGVCVCVCVEEEQIVLREIDLLTCLNSGVRISFGGRLCFGCENTRVS